MSERAPNRPRAGTGPAQAGAGSGRGSGARLSLRALGGRLGATWERERRDTLFLMGAIGLSILPHAAHLPAWCTAGFALLFLWRLGLVLSGRWLPRAAVRWVAALACLLAVWAQYGTLLGREPGVALLVLFLGLKLMEMRARRDLFVVIFLCLFLLLAAFLDSQGAGTALLVMAAFVALVASMITMHFGAHEQPPARRLGAAALLVAQALPLAAVLFVLFPRMAQPLWGMQGDGAAGRTGLSDTMTPGSIQKLGLSQEIAFRVRFEGEAPPTARLYWRGPTLGLYDGRTWRAGRDAPEPPPAPQVRAQADGARIDYVVTAEPSHRGELYALEMPAELPAVDGRTVAVTAEFGLLVSPPLAERMRWRGSALPDAAIGLNETAPSLRAWVQVPAGFNPRTHALAAQWRAGEPPPEQLVDRALAMFGRERFSYTLAPPPLGPHAVDDFLFGTRAGFCEHYASAFVSLMRILDIPARVVTGYQGGERDPIDGFWVVRQADAHAWAEVWLAGRGWVRVDPTAAIAPERIERGVRAARPADGALEAAGIGLPALWHAGLEAFSNRWNQWLLSYDQKGQQRLLRRLGLPVDDWLQLVGLMALALLVPVGAAALVTLRPRRAADPLERCWQAFCDKLAAAGVERAPQDTPNRLLVRIERTIGPDAPAGSWPAAGQPGGMAGPSAAIGQARRIVEHYNRLRYDSARPSPDSVRQLRRLIDAFKP